GVEDGERLGPAGKDVAGGHLRGGGKVGCAGPAPLLPAVRAVVGDLGVALGRGRARLRVDAGARRVAAVEKVQGVVPRSERHVIYGDVEDALGVAAQMRPERGVGGPEALGLVAQGRAGGIEAAPV